MVDFRYRLRPDQILSPLPKAFIWTLLSAKESGPCYYKVLGLLRRVMGVWKQIWRSSDFSGGKKVVGERKGSVKEDICWQDREKDKTLPRERSKKRLKKGDKWKMHQWGWFWGYVIYNPPQSSLTCLWENLYWLTDTLVWVESIQVMRYTRSNLTWSRIVFHTRVLYSWVTVLFLNHLFMFVSQARLKAAHKCYLFYLSYQFSYEMWHIVDTYYILFETLTVWSYMLFETFFLAALQGISRINKSSSTWRNVLCPKLVFILNYYIYLYLTLSQKGFMMDISFRVFYCCFDLFLCLFFVANNKNL